MMWLFILLIGCFQLSQSSPTATTVTINPTDVPDHLKSIISVIPKDLIRNITNKHLKTDEEFKAAVMFMQTAEWTDRVKTIREKPEWIALKKHMKEFGINMDIFIKCIDKFMQNVTVTFDKNKPMPKKSLKAFLVDVEQNLPTMKILTALNEKMISNTDIRNLFEKLSSTETHKLFDAVLSVPEVKKMLKDFSDMDLNIIDALSWIYAFLGWGELKLK